jgi:hypothetical protein
MVDFANSFVQAALQLVLVAVVRASFLNSTKRLPAGGFNDMTMACANGRWGEGEKQWSEGEKERRREGEKERRREGEKERRREGEKKCTCRSLT